MNDKYVRIIEGYKSPQEILKDINRNLNKVFCIVENEFISAANLGAIEYELSTLEDTLRECFDLIESIKSEEIR